MTELLFDFEDMLTEVDSFTHLAERFIAPECRDVLPNFGRNLDSYRHQPTEGATHWEIPISRPLRTGVSHGRYEKSPRRGEHQIFAEITANWHIRRVPPSKKKMGRSRYFKLIGIASTRARLMCQSTEGEP